ncbi:MAG: Crp/Fnr family transcriptional regulator [Saprospiraceae bacterium]
MQNLKRKIASYHKLTEQELNFALQFYEKVELKKGEFLLTEGNWVNKFYYLDQGCICFYSLKDGIKKVMEFHTEDSFFTDLYAYLEEAPSNCYLKAIEPCTIYAVSKTNVEKSFDYSHQLERSGRLSMQEAFLKIYRRISHFNNLSNEERYLKLLNKRPDLFQRVPQYLIASYLGLTPVGLSKIRKRLSQS